MRFNKLTGDFTAGRLSTATTCGGRLYLVRHDDLSAVRVDGSTLTPWLPPLAKNHAHVDDRYVHAAADPTGVIWFLDYDGTLSTRRHDHPKPEVVLGPDVRLAGHYAHRVGFTWDILENRLVIVGGRNRNDTHVVDTGSRTLRSLTSAGPQHGLGRAVGTSVGVFYTIANQIWRLVGDQWQQVGSYPGEPYQRPIPFADEASSRLLFLAPPGLGAATNEKNIGAMRRSPRDTFDVYAHDSEGFRSLGGFVFGVDLLDDHEASLGFDPAARQIVLVDEKGVRAAKLAEDTSGHWPAQIVASKPRTKTPPKQWFRDAVAIDTDPKAPAVKLPSELVPEGMIALAVLPGSDLMPLRGISLLLLATDPPYEGSYDELSFDNVFQVEISDVELPACLRHPEGGDKLRPLIEGPRFVDVDPLHVDEVDSTTDGAPRRTWSSKIGGYPALLQGGPEEASDAVFAELRCESCNSRLRFAAQLCKHFTAMSGVLYLYVCPKGCSGAAYVQSD